MTTGLISLGAGMLIGLLYALLKVRSPAPPAIALVGLLGMLIGGWLTADEPGPHENRGASSTLSQAKGASAPLPPTRAG